jgi:CDP-diacylglycerol--serine O-phosphatidyltransferase
MDIHQRLLVNSCTLLHVLYFAYMSKLPKANMFLDLSDYGRPAAIGIANRLRHTTTTPVHLTLAFFISGLLAVLCIAYHTYWAAAFFLILKSILDAADGELARVKETPSYTGRYFDSIADILLNAIIFFALWHLTNASGVLTVLSFIGLQLQGTLYNYYYVILRNRLNGDTTSRVFEINPPKALPGESQKNVNWLFRTYTLLYGLFDRTIYFLDPNASKEKITPKWFMTAVSAFGLGTQLLIIAVLLVLGLINFIIPFFIGYTLIIFVVIGIRRLL